MLKIGLTGGIGTGKSTVAKMFSSKGVPVYDSDSRAKRLMSKNENLIKELVSTFGQEVFVNQELNRAYLSSIVFSSYKELKKLNAIVHPFVADDFENWASKQTAKFIIKEAAILFESGAYKNVDKIILVSCPLSVRIDRVSKRDGISEKEIMKRVNNQMMQSEKASLSDFIIDNKFSLESLQQQVDDVYSALDSLV
jgi:dephospho-CoA kinase